MLHVACMMQLRTALLFGVAHSLCTRCPLAVTLSTQRNPASLVVRSIRSSYLAVQARVSTVKVNKSFF